MHGELLAMWQRERRTIVFVTHSISEALRMSDRVFVMTGRPGRIGSAMTIEEARPRNPHSPELLQLADQANRWLASDTTGRRATLADVSN